MKNWVKYIISTVIFFMVYTLVGYLFTKSIDWEMVIISTIIYAVLNPVCQVLFNKMVKIENERI